MNNKLYNLILKNQLLQIDTKKLQEIYKEDIYFHNFLLSLKSILEEESELFELYPEMISKAYNILGNKKQEKKFVNEINDIIIRLNVLNNKQSSEKELIAYIANQLRMRNIYYKVSNESFKDIIAYDCIIHHFIFYGVEKNIDLEFVLSSLNYFSEYIPEIFNEDVVINNVNIIIDTALETIKHADLNKMNYTYKRMYKKAILNTKKKIEKIIKTNQKRKTKIPLKNN